jgi:biopolymer transport protein ExbB
MKQIVEDTLKIWTDGGWLMIPLAVLSMAIYYSIVDLYFTLKAQCRFIGDEDRWKHWLEKPSDADIDIRNVFEHTQTGVDDMESIRARFVEVSSAQMPTLDQRIRFLMIIVSSAPLTGLLGTVTGMLSTFAGLSVSSGGDTVDKVAGGISEALITTETGLVLAIPAYVLLAKIKRMRDDLELFLRRAENLTMKRFARGLQPA